MSSYPHNFNPSPRKQAPWDVPYSYPYSDEFGPDGQPWYPDEGDSSSSVAEETQTAQPEKPKITPELQKRIEKARAEIQRRKKDNQWGGVCIAVQVLIQHGNKEDARSIVQTYLKEHQKGG